MRSGHLTYNSYLPPPALTIPPPPPPPPPLDLDHPPVGSHVDLAVPVRRQNQHRG